jgi:AraC-like DNA-binding protein
VTVVFALIIGCRRHRLPEIDSPWKQSRPLVQIIPLVRARYVHAFIDVLDRIGSPTGHLLHRARLTPDVMSGGERIIPAALAWDFIGSAAAEEGIDDFGLQAGEASIEAYGEFSRRLLQAPNLNHALQRFCQLARCEYSRADFYVSRERGRVWFCRGPIDGNDVERKHVELLVLRMMIATVRLAAGADWHPPGVFLQTNDGRCVAGHDELLSSNLRFGNRITAFEVPTELLPLRMPSRSLPLKAAEYDPLEHDLVSALRQIIASMPIGGDWGLTDIAAAVRLNARTLQRRLSDANTTFSQLVEDVRLTAAMSMVADTSMKVHDIALQLGYADQANFTRAFRRWAGVSPQAYRRQQAAGGE